MRGGRRRQTHRAEVISLSAVREKQRLRLFGVTARRVLDANQRAISRLHDTEALFTKEGARAGRDLLLAHVHLLRIVKLCDALADEGEVPAPRAAHEIQAAFRELDFLLEKTHDLTTRTGDLLAQLGSE